MEMKDVLWEKFESTGSIDAYLAYSRDCGETEDKEGRIFGNSGNGRDSDEGSEIR